MSPARSAGTGSRTPVAWRLLHPGGSAEAPGVASMKRLRALTLASLLILAAEARSLELSWSTVDGGGTTRSEGGGYRLGGTIGQPDAGASVAEGVILVGGFWAFAPAGPVARSPSSGTSANDLRMGTGLRLRCLNRPIRARPEAPAARGRARKPPKNLRNARRCRADLQSRACAPAASIRCWCIRAASRASGRARPPALSAR